MLKKTPSNNVRRLRPTMSIEIENSISWEHYHLAMVGAC